MAERRRGLAIGGYALLMALTLVSLTAAYGVVTYQQFERMRADVEQDAYRAAKAEIDRGMADVLEEARAIVGRFAARNEVRQRLRVPGYPHYLRAHRLPGANALSPAVIGDAVYAADGQVLNGGDSDRLPRRVVIPHPPAYVDWSTKKPAVLIFDPVRARDGSDVVFGYVGLRIDLGELMRYAPTYRHVDRESIHFEHDGASTQSWPELLASARFESLHAQISDDAANLLSDMIVKFAAILAVSTLLFFFLALLIARPLRSISTHIDRLKINPGGLMLESLAGALPVAETEKIRRSLNEYQEQLVDVHSTLEEQGRELLTMLHHDALTGAKNRRAFEEFTRNLPKLVGNRDLGVCYALFDVKHFKAINDTYGQRVGDQVLKVIAARIGSVLREGEELFRIGGDEFAVILLDCNPASALQLAERCHDKIVHYDFSRLGVREPLRISAGLASAQVDDLDDLHTLQWKADAAMYRAKRPGHANVVMFDESLARDSEGLFSSWVNTAVYDAVVYGKGLFMVYQPIVDLKDGDICHYEALIRIEQDGEIIQPSNIFPVIEARSLEVELDRAVVRKVIGDLACGKIQAGTGVSINLSGPSLVHEQVCVWMRDFEPFLGQYRIMIEVTETALITQIGLANENLSRLRARGFDIALDDFGSGYSSLRYLAAMPVDVVKFDVTLVQGLHDKSQANMVVHLAQMILESGHHLVAEGIEDTDMLESARAAGFAHGQGYLIGRPAERGTLERVVFDNVARFPSDRLA